MLQEAAAPASRCTCYKGLRGKRWRELCFVLLFYISVIGAVKLEGGSALAMAGSRCAVLAMDSRFGSR